MLLEWLGNKASPTAHGTAYETAYGAVPGYAVPSTANLNNSFLAPHIAAWG